MAAFIPAFSGGYVDWDDNAYIRDNRMLLDWAGLRQIWTTVGALTYHPLTFTSYWLEYRLWGATPQGYHATNILLHALNALLVFVLARRLGANSRTALIAGALFAVHPLQVASVAWLAERKNVLAGAFFLVSTLLYLRHGRMGGWRNYGGALVAFALSLLSKPAVALLPLSWWAIDYLILKRPMRNALVRLLPFVALSGAATLLAVHAEAANPGSGLAWGLRPLVAAGAIGFYISKLLCPMGLLAVYPRWEVTGGTLWLWAAMVGLLVAGVAAWRFRHRLDGFLGWSAVHFLAGLLPAVGLISFGYLYYSPVADHLMYFAVMGPFLLIGLLIDRLMAVAARGWERAILPVGTCVVLSLCTVLTWRGSSLWCNPERLWGHVLSVLPDSPIGNNQYGVALGKRGRTTEALKHYAAAVARWPDYGDALRNLGATLVQVGQSQEALPSLRRAASLSPKDATARYNLAVALLDLGDAAGALCQAKASVDLDPSGSPSQTILGAVLAVRGETDQAELHLRRALEIDQNNWRARMLLAEAYARRGLVQEAVVEQRAAVSIVPGDADLQRRLADLLMSANDYTGAAELYENIIRSRPNDAGAWCSRGLALERLGLRPQAVTAFRQAMAIHPDWMAASRLAWILATSKEAALHAPTEAVQLGEQARRLADRERARILDPLAAAYAATNRFPEAVVTAEKAKEIARQTGQASLERDIGFRLSEYRAGRAYMRY